VVNIVNCIIIIISISAVSKNALI